MDERVLRFRVGVVVVAAAIITIILITLLGAWPNPFSPRDTLHIRFDSAPGVTVDTPVRKNGVKIGRVSELELSERGVLLTLEIDSEYPRPGQRHLPHPHRLARDRRCRARIRHLQRRRT